MADIPVFVVPYWDDSPDSWDYCSLTDVATGVQIDLPGIIDPKSLQPKRSQKIDVKPAPGADGATITFQGIDLARFDIVCRMFLPEHWAQYQRVVSKLEPKPGKGKPGVWRVLHAKAYARNIQSAVIESVDGPSQQENGLYTLTLSCIEYKPIKRKPPATLTPHSATAGINIDSTLPTYKAPALGPFLPTDAGAAARRAPLL